jgi:RNA polymerase sigma-B factor
MELKTGDPDRGAPISPGNDRIAVLQAMYALTRDRRLRDEILAHYDGFAARLARTFSTRNEETEDLVQVARMGLIHAVDRFDPSRERPFVAYAQATILGELKRHIRDHTWRIRTPRSLQENYLLVCRTTDDLVQELGRSPRIPEIAARAGLSDEAVLEAMEIARSARPTTLDHPNRGADSTSIDPPTDDPGFTRLESRWTVDAAVGRLPPREQRILHLRFVEGLTQAQIAGQLGVSQMCISRILSRTLRLLQTRLAAHDQHETRALRHLAGVEAVTGVSNDDPACGNRAARGVQASA